MATAATLKPLNNSDMISEANTVHAVNDGSPEESNLKSHQNAEIASDSQPNEKSANIGLSSASSPSAAVSPIDSDASSPSSPSNSSARPSHTANETDDAGGDEEELEGLKVPFAPGDHITRWEMLPIAWPIQVHGIVLEVHDDAVVLVDFGLAAVPKGKNSKKNKKKAAAEEDTESNVEESENCEESEAKNDSGPEPKAEKKQQHQHVKNAIENFHKGFKKERNRLNVQTLTTQKEISKWSKVNYDGGLFGFGTKENGEEGKGDTNDEEAEEGKLSTDNESPRKESRDGWWRNWKKAQEKKKAEREELRKQKTADDAAKSASSSNDTIASSTSRSNSIVEIESADSSSTPTNVSGCGGMDATPWWCRVSMQRGKRRQSTDGKVTNAMMEASKNGNLVQAYKNTNEDDGDFLLELEKRQMRRSLQKEHDDYMAKGFGAGPATESGSPATTTKENVTDADNAKGDTFEEEKKDDHEFVHESSSAPKGKESHLSVITDEAEVSQTEAPSPKSSEGSPTSGSPQLSPSTNAESELESNPDFELSTKSESCTSPKKAKHESKADPPVVVLARTRWLLKHGEGILPPYHAFSSNSECMAVFCKTGYWSTLQADIFLHSTAIGNAKSTVVMTLGMAASVPMLAPVVGAVGLGAVVAPWFYLDKHKKASKEIGQRLGDQFWAQAEPEVIVACVQEWSNLESSA
ncbi:unnamed protein product [Cylindrotheca closterium]|uniref:Uncharacterized protein n=1 Tax=Cylindrotheca closterium TaxID=2856 RepID=A0AAD2CH45_9STRA|nr:unnamed protein product [Cylindrotheca closterium]